MTNTNRSKSSSPSTASISKCPPGPRESWSTLGKMVADRGELEGFGRGFNSSIAFWIMVRFAQECAYSRKTGFPVAQSSKPLTKHRCAFSGLPVSRNES